MLNPKPFLSFSSSITFTSGDHNANSPSSSSGLMSSSGFTWKIKALVQKLFFHFFTNTIPSIFWLLTAHTCPKIWPFMEFQFHWTLCIQFFPACCRGYSSGTMPTCFKYQSPIWHTNTHVLGKLVVVIPLTCYMLMDFSCPIRCIKEK